MNIFKLSYLNVTRRKSQSLLTGIITTITIMAFIIFISLTTIVIDGINLANRRLGADIIVVPSDIDIDSLELMFTGVPQSVYMDKGNYEKIKKIEGIDKITPQFFTATIEGAGCCGPDKSLRLVGIDDETDFILEPWFEEHNIQKLEPNEIVVGNGIPMILGKKIALLGDIFTITGTLYNTGTGMDDTIFMGIDKARELSRIKFSDEFWSEDLPEDSISSIFIKTVEGKDLAKIVNDINNLSKDIKAEPVSDSIFEIKNQFKSLAKLIFYTVMILLLVTFISLTGRYNSLIKDRKKEIGYLKGLGLQRNEIFKVLIYEVSIISLFFGLVGSIAGSILVSPILDTLKDTILIPSGDWNYKNILVNIGFGVLISLLLGFISALYPIINIYKLESHEAMSEGDIN